MDGPYGPYRQSERADIYRYHAARLLESKHAYRCFCSPERLDALNRSRHDKGLRLGYDRRCKHLPPNESDEKADRGEAHVIRLRAPNENPSWQDFVYGSTGKAGKDGRKTFSDDPVYDDPIMMKSDGHPTYHLANVVDDHLMKITHVIRGSEWMSSTPMHLAVYRAFGWEPPIFGHVPLLVDQNNQKLSKRNLDTDIAHFRDEQDIFPEALVNFAVLLGWSHQRQSDLMSLRQLENVFDLKFTKGNTIVSFAKLQYLQERHARQHIAEGGEQFRHMVEKVCSVLRKTCDEKRLSGTLGSRSLQEFVGLLLRADWKSYTAAAEFAHRISNIFNPVREPQAYGLMSPDFSLSDVRVAAASLLLVPEHAWTANFHRENIAAIQPPHGRAGVETGTPDEHVKAWKRDVYHFLRWSLMGGAPGPPLPDLLEILGRSVCVERINSAICKTLQQGQASHLEKPSVQPVAVAAA